jgi:hypothetical protein
MQKVSKKIVPIVKIEKKTRIKENPARD